MKKFLFGILASASLVFGSATIFSGSSQSIAIDSEPSGAKVFVDGQMKGVTPLSVMMDKTVSSHEIKLQKEGYADINVPMTQSYDPVAIVNIVWDLSTTDFLTGNVMEYAPNNYFFTLQKK